MYGPVHTPSELSKTRCLRVRASGGRLRCQTSSPLTRPGCRATESPTHKPRKTSLKPRSVTPGRPSCIACDAATTTTQGAFRQVIASRRVRARGAATEASDGGSDQDGACCQRVEGAVATRSRAPPGQWRGRVLGGRPNGRDVPLVRRGYQRVRGRRAKRRGGDPGVDRASRRHGRRVLRVVSSRTSIARRYLTIAEADKCSLLMLAALATIGQHLQLSVKRRATSSPV